MITAFAGPLVVRPEVWTLVFDRSTSTRWAGWLAMGRHKHVRAYAYVPFLHVWVFFDPHLRGIDIDIAADGEPARAKIAEWMIDADLVRMVVGPGPRRPPLLGFCVPTIKRLIGLRTGALRPSALYRSCLRHGGEPFEAADGVRPEIRTEAAG